MPCLTRLCKVSSRRARAAAQQTAGSRFADSGTKTTASGVLP